MTNPAVKLNDRVTGQCNLHQIPSPSGAPMPPPAPLPFSAPLTQALTTTVMIEGGPAAVQGSSGLNTPAHTGLHASDPHLTPPTQQARIIAGSSSVFFDGKAAAHSGCQTVICFQTPGQLTGTATTVLVAA